MDLLDFTVPVDYDKAHRLQLELNDKRSRGEGNDTLILLEHPHVITLGKFADSAGVVVDEATLASKEILLRRVERGGQATYHGPGQLVGYLIIELRREKIGVKTFVHMVEELMIRAAKLLGVSLFRVPGRQGVFHQTGKVGAVGVALRRGVTMHGFALNVSTELDKFENIIPCGITDISTTSLNNILAGATPNSMDSLARVTTVKAAKVAVREVFFDIFNKKLEVASVK